MKNHSTFLTVLVEVSCIFRFTPGANSIVHRLQSRNGGLILCWRRIRKFAQNRQTENSKPEATLILLDRWSEQANLTDIILLKPYQLIEINFIKYMDKHLFPPNSQILNAKLHIKSYMFINIVLKRLLNAFSNLSTMIYT